MSDMTLATMTFSITTVSIIIKYITLNAVILLFMFIGIMMRLMEQPALNNINNCLDTNIYSYLETSGGQSYDVYLNVVHLSTPVLIRHLWQLKTVVFLHWCLIHAVL